VKASIWEAAGQRLPCVSGPRLLPRLEKSKTVKNRVHLDLGCDELDAELARLVGLGARVLAWHEDLVVLADPEGGEFCVLRPSRATP
jgi:predicted enzyme related to lactoylglutathione lyase